MRSKRAEKRRIEPDPVYKSRVLTRFINVIMWQGKKDVAEGIVYEALEMISEDKKEAVATFEQAIKQIMPIQEVRSRRVGGATYQIPMPLRHDRAEALAIRWLAGAARAKKGKSMATKLYEEIVGAKQGQGAAIKKRENTHKMAEANKAFAHFKF